MHEEPFGLAVAEALALCRLRSLFPFVFSSAQNLDKRYPPPFRWFERWCIGAAGAYGCNAEGGSILRRKGLRREFSCPLGWMWSGSCRSNVRPLRRACGSGSSAG